MPRPKTLPGSKGTQKTKKKVKTGHAAVQRNLPKKVASRFQADDHVSWRFSMIDTDGPWSCYAIDGATLLAILERLRSYEGMRYAELTRPRAGGKEVHAGGVCTEAFDRLRELRLDDASHLFELHLTGLWRVWAIQVGMVLHLLWWDPDHTVWPSEKKHT